jgi:hypothetical protein
MKTSMKILWQAALTFAAIESVAVYAAENKPVALQTTPRSVFVEPASPKDGRDPFYPESKRFVAEQPSVPSKTVERAPDVTSVKVLGISGTADHLMAIINNHTFAEGDEGDVLTSSGRVHLRCLAIRPDSVTVEIGGRTQNLKLEIKN